MASICDVFMVEALLGVDPTQSYGENTKNPNQEFIDFAIKTYWKIIVFHNFLTINCYFHIFFVWFYYILMIFNWNGENKFLKFLEIFIFFKYSVFMINKILWNWSKTSMLSVSHANWPGTQKYCSIAAYQQAQRSPMRFMISWRDNMIMTSPYEVKSSCKC